MTAAAALLRRVPADLEDFVPFSFDFFGGFASEELGERGT